MTTLSSAFMSSRRARMVRSVSLALWGRETVSGVRRGARESAGVCRGADPFCALHSPPGKPGGLREHNYLVLFFLPRRLPVLAANFRFGDFVPRFLLPLFAVLNFRALLALWRERSGCPNCPRRARRAVEDKGDLRP